MARDTIEFFPDRDFGITYDNDKNPHMLPFHLHNHNDLYEIILFLNGDCEFHVEGNAYRLKTHDIIFTRPFEMHKMMILSQKSYERMVLFIKSAFFKKNHCEHLLDVFENRPLGIGNCISGNLTSPSPTDCMRRFYLYCEKKVYDIAEHTLFEFLYLMNEQKKGTETSYIKDNNVRSIILYINDHLSEQLSLDMLSQKFFLSKNTICRIFKENTGHTVSHYITHKRILLVQELHRNGQTLTQASLNAGFHSYANFYKAYVKQIGDSPKKMD